MRLAWTLAGAAALCYVWLVYLILRDGGALMGAGAALDLRAAGYSVEAARDWLSGLSEAQRAAYFGQIGLVDTIFPVLLGAALSVFLWQLGGKWTIVAPVAYAVFDLIENATIRSLPGAADFAQTARLASDLTTFKFAALGLSVLALIWAYQTRRVL